MALFGKKKEETKNEKPVSGASSNASASSTSLRNLSTVLTRPIITEKAALLGDSNVYTFEISRHATKQDVKDAVIALFKVTPVRVNTVWSRPRSYVAANRGKRRSQSGMKKAYIHLKKGDRIDLV